eukprot:1963534-Rhodomonas_salina.1
MQTPVSASCDCPITQISVTRVLLQLTTTPDIHTQTTRAGSDAFLYPGYLGLIGRFQGRGALGSALLLPRCMQKWELVHAGPGSARRGGNPSGFTCACTATSENTL